MSLKCMNEVFGKTGECTHFTPTQSAQEDPVPCLDAWLPVKTKLKSFLNQRVFTLTGLACWSEKFHLISFICRQTLISRPEFCLFIIRLSKSCNGVKEKPLSRNYTELSGS